MLCREQRRRTAQQPPKEQQATSTLGRALQAPQTSLAVTVRGKVLQKVHEYDAVESCPVLGPSDTPLCQEDFVANHEPTLPFYDVRGTSAKSPYFSPNSENVGLPIADQFVTRYLFDKKQLHKIGEAWKGFFSDASYKLIFISKSGPINFPETQ